MFYDFEATKNTGTHTIDLSIAQDLASTEKNTYITVLRNSVKASLMKNLRGTPSLPIIARDTTVTLF